MLRTNPHSLWSCLCCRVLRLNFDTTDQIAECYRASASGSVDLRFNYEFGQPMTLKIGIHSFPARRSALKGQCEEQTGKFTCSAYREGT